MIHTRLAALAALALWPLLLAAQEKVDLTVIHQIKTEAFDNTKVMDHLFYLTDVHGPRLTGSPNFQAAGDWAVKTLRSWGLDTARQEKWGPFGQGWSLGRFAVHMVEPQYASLIGLPLAWSPGIEGILKGEPMLAPAPAAPAGGRGGPGGPGGPPGAPEAELDRFFERFKGKLGGKIVLLSQPQPLQPQTAAATVRFLDNELLARAAAPEPGPGFRRGAFDREQGDRRRNRMNQFLKDEGVLAVITTGSRNDGGTIFAPTAGSRDPKAVAPPPTVALAAEHYNRITRMLEKKIPVRLEIELQAKFHEAQDSFNVVAELPGGRKRDELVMLGAHLDSYANGTGATDNAAGSAVVLEALRILKSLNLKMDRTVRLALWSGEEQGLLGSRAYVKEHFADRETMNVKPEHAKLAGYFNLDNGTGKVRGVYLQNNDMMRPVFEAWLAPFKDLGAATISIRNTTGTDHLSFDAVGLPGFQFIQDPVEYDSRTHHSNMDVYDRIVRGDMMQASAIMASFVYLAATREEMLPRKPLPKPERREGGPPGRPSSQ